MLAPRKGPSRFKAVHELDSVVQLIVVTMWGPRLTYHLEQLNRVGKHSFATYRKIAPHYFNLLCRFSLLGLRPSTTQNAPYSTEEPQICAVHKLLSGFSTLTHVTTEASKEETWMTACMSLVLQL